MTPETLPVRPFWADADLIKLPKRWEGQTVAEWRRLAAQSRGGADAWLKRRLAEIEAASRAGLHPGMDDRQICKLAEAEAKDYAGHLASIEGVYRKRWAHMPEEMRRRCIVWKQGRVCLDLMRARGLGDLWPDGPDMTDAGRLARLCAPEFWRRAFRKAHARTLEQCAIALGFVRADGDCYISKESRGVYAQRQAANAAMLAATIAVNEHGQEKTLQSLAERSVANPAIRRGELMTRVSGFEGCADALGHVKRWAVITCPSRMHKWTKLDSGKTVPNKRYDGTKPREAQAYLANQWRKACAWWERQGLRLYGFRTTEPHHDGCPHWNLLAFFAPMTERVIQARQCKLPTEAVAVFDAGLRRYFLDNESPDEPGARAHRVRIEAIDSSKGSAAAYIAKYISKGIDGHGLTLDLYGNPIEEAAPAVVAWARVWGIRQFQQIGGPPVTVWRELRRLHPDNLGTEQETPDTLAAALAAVNLQLIEPGEKKAVAWMRYTNAQGGPTCKRAGHRVRLLRRESQQPNRYGEAGAPKTIGVWADGFAIVPGEAVGGFAAVKDEQGKTKNFKRRAIVGVDSERAEWIVVPKAATDDAFREHCARLEAKIEQMDQHAARVAQHRLNQFFSKRIAEEILREAQPWTRVNNCTPSFTPTLDSIDRRAPESPFATLKKHRRKLGRFKNWDSGGAGAPSKGAEHEPAMAAA